MGRKRNSSGSSAKDKDKRSKSSKKTHKESRKRERDGKDGKGKRKKSKVAHSIDVSLLQKPPVSKSKSDKNWVAETAQAAKANSTGIFRKKYGSVVKASKHTKFVLEAEGSKVIVFKTTKRKNNELTMETTAITGGAVPKDIKISFGTDVFAMTSEQARQFERDWQLVTMIDASDESEDDSEDSDDSNSSDSEDSDDSDDSDDNEGSDDSSSNSDTSEDTDSDDSDDEEDAEDGSKAKKVRKDTPESQHAFHKESYEALSGKDSKSFTEGKLEKMARVKSCRSGVPSDRRLWYEMSGKVLPGS
jgi:hypothetical protein